MEGAERYREPGTYRMMLEHSMAQKLESITLVRWYNLSMDGRYDDGKTKFG